MTEPQPVDEAGQLIPTPPELKGEALAQALDDAGLPKTGTADEKRASLAVPTEPEPEESVNPGLALAAPAYSPPAADFEHTAFNPENVQNIS